MCLAVPFTKEILGWAMDYPTHRLWLLVCLRTCDYLGVCISYVAGVKLRNYSWNISK